MGKEVHVHIPIQCNLVVGMHSLKLVNRHVVHVKRQSFKFSCQNLIANKIELPPTLYSNESNVCNAELICFSVYYMSMEVELSLVSFKYKYAGLITVSWYRR